MYLGINRVGSRDSIIRVPIKIRVEHRSIVLKRLVAFKQFIWERLNYINKLYYFNEQYWSQKLRAQNWISYCSLHTKIFFSWEKTLQSYAAVKMRNGSKKQGALSLTVIHQEQFCTFLFVALRLPPTSYVNICGFGIWSACPKCICGRYSHWFNSDTQNITNKKTQTLPE